MKLPQLQSLLPGRGMMFVALGLSLAIGWYFYNASGVADHLTKRNFNFLNQIGSNIDASVDAAGQFGRFLKPRKIAEDIYREYHSAFGQARERFINQSEDEKKGLIPVRKPSSKEILRNSLEEVFEAMKSRLVGGGNLVKDLQHVSIEIAEEKLKARVLTSNADGQNEALVPRDAAWLSLPAKTCENEECVKEVAACLTITKPVYAPVELVSTGFRSSFSILLSVPEVDFKQCRTNQKMPENYLRATFSVTIPFVDIEGVSSGDTAFDTVLLAKSEGKSDGSPLIFSNADEQSYSGGLFQLLNASSRFERYSSIRHFESRNSSSQNDPFDMEKTSDLGDTQHAFTQSTVIPFQIGGFSKLAFVQPFFSAQMPEQDNLVLIGIVAESRFNKSKYAVPYNWLSNALLLLLLGLLSLNFARLKLIKNKGILRRSDVYISIFSLAGVASLFVVFLIHILASREFNTLFDEDAKTIHASLSGQFEDELEAKIQQIESIHFNKVGVWRMNKAPDCPIVSAGNRVERDIGDLGPEKCSEVESNDIRYQCATGGFPEVTTQFLLDKHGTQSCYYVTHNASTGNSGFSVPDRDYFKKIQDGESWKTTKTSWSKNLQKNWGETTGFRGEFYLDRIESKTNGAQQTAISYPIVDSVLVALAKFYSLEHTVLPPGHGFSVFDNKSGLVLFHSNESHNLRENFYRATDDDEELKSAVLSRSKRKVSLTYKGDLVNAIVSPLKNTQWTLVTFHRSSIVDAFNFHLGTSALILAGVYIAICLVALPGLILLLRWLYRMAFTIRVEEMSRDVEVPQWMFPERGKSTAQRGLATTLLQLLVAYIACIYFFDLPEARLWMLIVLIAVPICWFYFLHMKPESTEKVPIGKPFLAREEPSTEDLKNGGIVKAFGLYRLNITLSILLLAVLPTLLLSNENHDVHQNQWLQFSHWFNVEKLKHRSSSYRQMNSKFLPTESSCSEADVEDRGRRGIYIPRANFTVENLPTTDFDPIGSDTSSSISDILASQSLSRMKTEIRVGGEGVNQHCIDDIALSNTPDTAVQSSGVRGQIGYLDSILSVLPSFGVEGELIEGLDGKRAVYDKGASRLELTFEDVASDLSYTVISGFPQTRPRSAIGIFLWIVFYISMVLVVAALVASLAGFLVRRFLSRSFEENLLSTTTIPIARDLSGGAILVRPSDVEVDDAYQTVLRILGLEANDFEVVAGADTLESQVVATEKSAKLVIVRDFFGVTQDHATSSEALSLVRQRLREGYSLILLSDIDPNHWAKSDQVTDEAFEPWEGIINSLSIFMLPILGEGRSLDNRQYVLSPRVYKRVWRRCSEDEQMVLAGLCHEGIVNPQNEFTLRSLYRRRLVNFQNSHFEFGDMDWRDYVAENLTREDFRARARRYKNSVWISFRGPMILILLVLVMFIAYVAQDEMRLLFSLIASIGAGAASLSALGGRFRSMATNAASE